MCTLKTMLLKEIKEVLNKRISIFSIRRQYCQMVILPALIQRFIIISIKCSSLLAITEIQNRATVSCHFTHIGNAVIKKTTASRGRNWNPPTLLVEYKLVQSLWKTFSQKVNHVPTLFSLKYIPSRIKTYIHKNWECWQQCYS